MHQWATIKDLNLRANLSALIGQKIAREDLDALIAMDGMDKGSTEGLVAGFAEKLNNNDPMLGIKFYLERFPDGQLIHDLLRRLPPDAPFGDILPLIRGSSVQSPEKQLFARWAEISPDQAAQFVTGNLDTVRIESVEVLLRKWGGIRGGSSASEWVRTLPPGPVRDKSASLLGFQLSEIQPKQSWEMAQLISTDSDGNKTRLLQRVYDVWVSTDPVAANQALDAWNAGK